jgi:CRISPR-associated endonuclease/helicase Cas3
VLVIRNTVGGAVAVQRALEALAGPDHPMLFRANDIVTLHHGRFALGDRRVLDAAVEMVLGGERAPGGLVVIGTQTLEQSLDIDADLLLTDLCPVDVLLQRVGRLHRHARVRVPEFEVPQCRILVPVNRDLLPFARRGRHGLGAYVYDDLRIIEATWRLVELHGEWRIPAMNRMLVERATHPEVLQTLWDELALRDPAWTKHIETVTGEDRQHSRQAALSVFNRNAPFGDFRVSDERLATRLGGADLQLAFDPAPAGPFGVPVVSMRLPCHMRGEASPPDGPVTALPDRDGFTFVLGQTSFRYTRLGLERG